jgi:hypothetical protein
MVGLSSILTVTAARPSPLQHASPAVTTNSTANSVGDQEPAFRGHSWTTVGTASSTKQAVQGAWVRCRPSTQASGVRLARLSAVWGRDLGLSGRKQAVQQGLCLLSFACMHASINPSRSVLHTACTPIVFNSLAMATCKCWGPSVCRCVRQRP